MTPFITSSKPKKSIFPIMTIALALTFALSYVALSAFGSGNNLGTGLTASVVLAQNAPGTLPGAGGGGLEDPLGNPNGSLTTFLNAIIDKVIIPLGAIVIVFALIFAGYTYVTAQGDTKKIQAAHSQLTWTAIGAAILLGAKVLSSVITNTVSTLSS